MPNKLDDPDLVDKPLTGESKLVSFDVESNGLHGPAFAVGAVLMDASDEVLSEFNGRCPIRGQIDPWVKDNVLPAMKDFPEDYANGLALRQAFWQWLLDAKASADFVLVSNGYPVEMRFLIACQEDNLDKRYWQHPFPLIELNSLLFQIGVKSRHRLVADKLKTEEELVHNPRWDAWVSGLAAFAALRRAGRLKD